MDAVLFRCSVHAFLFISAAASLFFSGRIYVFSNVETKIWDTKASAVAYSVLQNKS